MFGGVANKKHNVLLVAAKPLQTSPDQVEASMTQMSENIKVFKVQDLKTMRKSTAI